MLPELLLALIAAAAPAAPAGEVPEGEPPRADGQPATADPATAAPAAPVAETSRLPVALPASFTGSLPCDDCPPLEATLTLFADGTFRMRSIQEDRPGEFHDLGTWELWGPRLTLRGEVVVPLAFEFGPDGALSPVAPSGEPVEGAGRLEPAEPDLLAGPMGLTGRFTYLADAARFVECQTGLSLPVAMEEDYLALERAYSQAAPAPGEPVLAMLDGRFEFRPAMDGPGEEAVLVVAAFQELRPDGDCPRAGAHTELENAHWRLVTLGDRMVRAIEGFREPHLRFRNGRLAGSGGCNAVGGDYATEGSRLTIGERLASTMMACPEPVASLERDFLDALARVTRFRVRGDRLDLFNPAGGLEAHLQAVWLD